MAEGRDESPIRLPALLLRMLRSPFRPPGLVSTQDGPATGPRSGAPRCAGPRCAGDPGGPENSAKRPGLSNTSFSNVPFALGPRVTQPQGGGMARPALSSLFSEYSAVRAPECKWGEVPPGSRSGRPRGSSCVDIYNNKVPIEVTGCSLGEPGGFS